MAPGQNKLILPADTALESRIIRWISSNVSPRTGMPFSFQVLPAEKPVFDQFRAQGGDPDLLRWVIGVAPEYLDAARAEMRREFGTLEGYFSEGLHVDESAQEALRAVFVESV